jgi:hypothetical protein
MGSHPHGSLLRWKEKEEPEPTLDAGRIMDVPGN